MCLLMCRTNHKTFFLIEAKQISVRPLKLHEIKMIKLKMNMNRYDQHI